jgi:outer membrane immunogenic protein
MRSFTKIFMASTALCAVGFSANAADMAVKAPMAVPVEVYNWTGFYFGGHLGGGWLDSSDGIATYQRFTGAAPGVPHPLQTGIFNSNDNGFVFAGFQGGYNWQFGSVVAGIEADLSAAGPRQNRTVLLTEGPITDIATSTRGLDWFGTVRARLGYLFNPRVLAYVTGGFAYGYAHNNFNQFITGPGPVGTFGLQNFSRDSTGWTGGGGLEYMISRQWSVKGEYQYLQLGDAIASTTKIAFNPGKGGNTGVFTTQSGDTKAHTVQVGLNYHFWAP